MAGHLPLSLETSATLLVACLGTQFRKKEQNGAVVILRRLLSAHELFFEALSVHA